MLLFLYHYANLELSAFEKRVQTMMQSWKGNWKPSIYIFLNRGKGNGYGMGMRYPGNLYSNIDTIFTRSENVSSSNWDI